MKAMIYFADMLRANLVSLNSTISESRLKTGDLESLLKELGGVTYSNVITSGPDTPRGLGIFFSGKSPKNSGIDRRSKYPGPFLSDEDSQSLSEVLAPNVKFHVVTKNLPAAGLALPRALQERAILYSDVTQIPATGPSFGGPLSDVILVLDNSYHKAVGSRRGHHSAHKLGSKQIARNLRIAVSHLQLCAGDAVFLFSDHGCKLSSDKSFGYDYDLGRDRSQIVFFFSKLDHQTVSVNSNLYAMEDVHVMVKDALRRMNDGSWSTGSEQSAFCEPPARKMVHVEDHRGYSTTIGSPVNQWAVFATDFEYYEPRLGCPNVRLLRGAKVSIEKATALSQDFLRTHASNYANFEQEYDLLLSGFSRIRMEEQIKWINSKDGNETLGLKLSRIAWSLLAFPKAIARRLFLLIESPAVSSGAKSNTGSNQKVEF